MMKNSDHKLPPCPASPNCVSSFSTDRKHSIEPLRYTGTRDEARERLMGVLRGLARTRIVRADQDYVHAEVRSSFFKFVDDVEFYLPETGNIIHVRSASRVGYSDFGANRKRVEQIRAAFMKR